MRWDEVARVGISERSIFRGPEPVCIPINSHKYIGFVSVVELVHDFSNGSGGLIWVFNSIVSNI